MRYFNFKLVKRTDKYIHATVEYKMDVSDWKRLRGTQVEVKEIGVYMEAANVNLWGWLKVLDGSIIDGIGSLYSAYNAQQDLINND